MSHTPKPWPIHKTPNDADFTHEVAGICAIYAGNENAEADARLIAASPELLEALKLATEGLRIWAPADSHITQFDALIAKADGTTP
jgi:hypothetical protein